MAGRALECVLAAWIGDCGLAAGSACSRGRPADFDHASRLDQIGAALATLGKRLTIGLSDAA